jgi:heme-degrading monooxygenase HmoA
MAAFNAVRFRVKPGFEQQFIDAHRKRREGFAGFEGGWLVRTGDQTFCVIGQWKSFRHLVDARPEMIGILDEMRHMLDDLGGGLGVTDPVSGEVVASFGPKKAAKKAAKKRAPARRKKARRKKR